MSDLLKSSPKATRRQLLGGAGLVLLSAACGGEQESDQQTSGSEGFPVSIEHRYGSTRIDSAPERVVTVGLTEQDYVLALGVAPVATREWFGKHDGALWPWARKALGEQPVPKVLPRQELNFEQVAALQPDLILGINSGLTEHDYGLLSDMAPTVAQSDEYADYGTPWQQLTRTTGKALGKPEQADKLVRDIEKRFASARQNHSQFADGTAILASSIGGKAYIYPEGPAVNFLSALGLETPPSVAKVFGDKREPMELSLERLDLLDAADVVIMGLYDSQSGSVTDEKAYQALQIAQQGRDVPMPEMSKANGALSFGSVLSLPVALDLVVPRLATANDGDPDTTVSPVPDGPR